MRMMRRLILLGLLLLRPTLIVAQTPTPAIPCTPGTTPISVTQATSGDDGDLYTASVASYASLACQSANTTNTYLNVRRGLSTNFYQREVEIRFNVGATLPAGAVLTQSDLRMYMPSNVSGVTFADNDSRSLDIRYCSPTWAPSCTDWLLDPAGTVANNTTTLATIGASLDAYQTFTLSNIGSIATGGYQSFCLWVSGGEPTAENRVLITSADAGSNEPVWEACYYVPTPTPTLTPTATPTATATPTTTPQSLTCDELTTITLGYPHGFLCVDRHGTCFSLTQSSTLIRFDAPKTSLATRTLLTLGSGENSGSDIVDSPTNDRLYVVFQTSPVLVEEIDPVTLSHTTVISDGTYTNNGGTHPALKVDATGTYLYVLTNGNPDSYLLQYRMSDWTRMAATTLTGFTGGHALQIDGTNLYGNNVGTTPGKVFKADQATLTPSYYTFSGSDKAVDDLALTANYVWVPLQNRPAIMKFAKADITAAPTEIAVPSWPNGSWGTFPPAEGKAGEGGYIWSALWSSPTTPGALSRINPGDDSSSTYIFPSGLNNPSEMDCEGTRPWCFAVGYTNPMSVCRFAPPGVPTFSPTSTSTVTPVVTATPTATAVDTPIPTSPTFTPNPTLTPTTTPTVAPLPGSQKRISPDFAAASWWPDGSICVNATKGSVGVLRDGFTHCDVGGTLDASLWMGAGYTGDPIQFAVALIDTAGTPTGIYSIQFACVCINSGDVVNSLSYGTAQTATVTLTGALRYAQLSAVTAPMTCGGTCQASSDIAAKATVVTAGDAGTVLLKKLQWRLITGVTD